MDVPSNVTHQDLPQESQSVAFSQSEPCIQMNQVSNVVSPNGLYNRELVNQDLQLIDVRNHLV